MGTPTPEATVPAIARTDTETALASEDPVEVADAPAGTWQASTGPSVPTYDRFPIEQITPQVEGGRFPAKAVVGELIPVTAVSYREGHSMMGCNVVLIGPDGREGPFSRMGPGAPGTDRWHGTVRPDAVGAWTFAVEAFSDPYLTWHDAVTKKIGAGQGLQELGNDLAEGAALLNQAATGVPAQERPRVTGAAQALTDTSIPLFARISPALGLTDVLWRYPVRQHVTRSKELPIAVVEQVVARAGGIPLFVEAMLESGTDCTFPDSMQDLILGAVERLPEETQRVLRVAAAGGIRVGHALLAAVSNLSDLELEAALRPAIAGNVLQIADTDKMTVVAEVYETDVARLREWLGRAQSVPVEVDARVLEGSAQPLKGTVTAGNVAPMIAKNTVFALGPREDADRRVVEVEVRLDPTASAALRDFIGIQVRARFLPRN